MLTVTNFSYSYKEQQIFKVANFCARPGDVTLLLGESGIGKSTLLDIVAGLKVFQSGKYIYDGKTLNTENDEEMSRFRSSRIGYIPQDFALIDDYSVMDNLLLPALYQTRRSEAQIQHAVTALLEKFQLEQIATKKVSSISGGQKQRIAIIRSLALEPEILIADEITANLDESNFELVKEVILEQKQKNRIVIIASHDMRLLEIADKIYRIEDCKLQKKQ